MFILDNERLISIEPRKKKESRSAIDCPTGCRRNRIAMTTEANNDAIQRITDTDVPTTRPIIMPKINIIVTLSIGYSWSRRLVVNICQCIKIPVYIVPNPVFSLLAEK